MLPKERRTMENQIIYFMKRLCDANLTTSLGGNISYKTDDGKIIITPSSIDKACLTLSDLVILNTKGEVLAGRHEPSMEYMMHVMVYQQRPDVNAVIHAHPFYSTMFSASEKEINLTFTSEACKNIKHVGIAKYQMMGTLDLAKEVARVSKTDNVILLENHGVLTTGKDLLQAFYRMEVLEQAAKMTWHSLLLSMKELPPDEIRYLKSL